MKHVVALVGGAYFFDEEAKVYRATKTTENYKGIIGDVLRLNAAAELYLGFGPDASLWILGGATPWHQEHPDAPVLSQVIKDELMRDQFADYRESELDIKLIEPHPLTGSFNQLLYLVMTLNETDFNGQVHIVSNRWQLGRISAFIMKHKDLAMLRTKNVKLVSAEGYLLDHDPDDMEASDIARMYDMPEMHETIHKELTGRDMVMAGTYKFPVGFPAR